MKDGAGPLSDEALLARFRRGEPRAFDILVRRHHRRLFNFIARLVRSRSVAEELTQEAFIRVVENADALARGVRFTTWLYTIGRNLCIDEARKQVHRNHASLDMPIRRRDTVGPLMSEAVPDKRPEASTDRAAIGREVGRRIRDALDQLPLEQREVFLLREVGGIPFKDIATMLQVPENTAKSRMRYALEHLQASLSDYASYIEGLQ